MNWAITAINVEDMYAATQQFQGLWGGLRCDSAEFLALGGGGPSPFILSLSKEAWWRGTGLGKRSAGGEVES